VAGIRWGIVGGGVLGMELGRRLARTGDEVTVFEAAPDPGGLASTWEIAGTRWDKHYHVILPTDRRLLAMLADLGLEDEVVWSQSSTGCYAGGKLYSVSNTAEFLRFPPLRLVDKFRLGLTMLYASRVRNWRRLERIPVSRWLTRWSGARTYREFWRPLLRSKLGDNTDKASAAFIWAIMQRLYKARTSGAKVEKLGYVRNGYYGVLNALVAATSDVGVKLITSARVATVSGTDGVGATIELADGTEHSFDRVIVTTPAPVIADLVPALEPRQSQTLRDMVYQGIVCVSVVLDRPLGGYYVTNITDDGFDFTGVIEMTALVDPATFGGKHLVFLPRYTTADDEAIHWSDEEVIERFTASLRRMYPDLKAANILETRISRVRHVLAVSVLNHSEAIPDVWSTVPNVAIVSSAQILQGTLNVDETLGVIEHALPILRATSPSAPTKESI
jgi:protoporphyrinogen oxidase